MDELIKKNVDHSTEWQAVTSERVQRRGVVERKKQILLFFFF